jgi:hypothetical protein
MKKYYNNDLGKDFSSKLDELKKRLRSQSFNPATSKYGIAGNTFRAYRNYKTPPSKVYREWAKEVTSQLLIDRKIPNLSNQNKFDKWHLELFDSINQRWNTRQNKTLSFAHTFKLLDLYLKWLSSNKECPKELSESILKFGYCALDSQILLKLNECLNGALPLKNPSMGDIINSNTYEYCQKLIKDFCEKYGGTRLLFDYYAWEKGGASKK